MTKNARIESYRLCFDRGFLTFWMQLDYGDSQGQGFGGWVLQGRPGSNHYSINNVCGHYLTRVMQITEVDNLENIIGKTIRVDGDFSRIEGIGHILKDDWFYPAKELPTS